MGPEFNWEGRFNSSRPAEELPPVPEPSPVPAKQKTAKTEQELCDELFALGDMMSCHIFSMDGEVLGTNFGDVPVDAELREGFGKIAANVWSGIREGESVGGPFLLTTIAYERFKIVGIPFATSGVGVLAVVEDKVDAMYVKDRIIEFVKYWNQINKLRKHVREGGRQ